MAGSIENRLRRLEASDMPPCPRCGDDGDSSNVRFDVVWGDEDQGETDEPERCPECGRVLEIVVTWGDE